MFSILVVELLLWIQVCFAWRWAVLSSELHFDAAVAEAQGGLFSGPTHSVAHLSRKCRRGVAWEAGLWLPGPLREPDSYSLSNPPLGPARSVQGPEQCTRPLSEEVVISQGWAETPGDG